MRLIHLIVGDITAVPLITAVAQEEQLAGEVLVLKDILHVGPLLTAGLSFSEGRQQFWQQIQPDQLLDPSVDDLERLMQLSTQMSNDPDIHLWFWMAPTPADICAYYWLLHYLKKHQGRLSVINGSGLPFLDEEGKLFYPDSWGLLPVKEVIKARKLARVLTPAEWETDGEEWSHLVTENAGLRLLSGGKQLQPTTLDYYDAQLLALCKPGFQKGTKIVQQAMIKNKIPTGDYFLLGRLHELVSNGILEKNKSDFKLAGDKAVVVEPLATTAEETEE